MANYDDQWFDEVVQDVDGVVHAAWQAVDGEMHSWCGEDFRIEDSDYVDAMPNGTLVDKCSPVTCMGCIAADGDT